MNKLKRFEYIADKAKIPAKNWSNAEKAKFHYFNPNGLIAKKRKINDMISEMVNQGRVPAGWIVAYGSFNDYYENEMIKLAGKDRVARKDYIVVQSLLAREIRDISQRIGEVMQVVA